MKKIFALILSLLLTASSVPVLAEEKTVYYVGDSITVTIDPVSKTLTVSGEGALPDYSSASYAPWYANSYAVTVFVEDGITSVGNRCFSGNSNTTTVILGDSVKRVGVSAFSNNSNLKTIELPPELERIEDYAFYTSAIKTVYLPDSLKHLGAYAFASCSALATIENVPDGIEYIDASAFLSTKYYNSFSNGLNTVGIYTMQYKGAFSADTLTVPENVRVISANTLANASSLKTLVIPNSVEKILSSAFYHCTSLKEVSIPDSVTEIGDFAFGYKRDTDYYTPIPISGFKITGHGGAESERYATYCNFEFECLCEPGDFVTHPFCEFGGEATVGCKYCKKPLYTVTVSPTSHKFGQKVTTPATCTEGGSVTSTCTLCGYTETVYLSDAFGHIVSSTPTIQNPTCTERGRVYYTCAVCGEECGESYYIAPTGHTPGEMTTVTEPTCTECGLRESVCTSCGEVVSSEEIAPTGHVLPKKWTVLIPSNTSTLESGFRVRPCTVCGVAVEYEYFLAGDVNGDGKLNSRDLAALKRILAGTENAENGNCDLNSDGMINSKDLTSLKRVFAG